MPRGPGARAWRRLLPHPAVAASYLALTLVYLRPFGTHLLRTLPRAEQNDVLLHGWILNWTARQLLRAPWRLFDANVFFPHRDALAYTEHLLPEALPVAPLYAITGNAVLTYNVAYLLTFVLGGWGAFLLARRLTGDPWAAWVAGAFVCYFPAKRWNLAHINTIAVHGVPFAMLALHAMLQSPRWRRALLAGVAVALASLTSAYYTVYLPLLLLPGAPLLWWADRRPVDRRRVGALIMAASTSAVVALAVLWPYTRVWSSGAGGQPWDLQVKGAADVAEFFILDSLLWRDLLLPEVLDPLTSPFFPGLLVTCLLIVGCLSHRRGGAATPDDAGTVKGRGDREAVPGRGDGRGAPGREGRRAALARAAGVLGYALGAGALAVTFWHLVRHHRATVALAQPPGFPLLTVSTLAIAGLALVGGAERRVVPLALGRAAARLRAAPRPLVAYGVLAATASVLALGPRLKFFGYEGPPLPYELVYRWVPAASSLRAPFRAAMLGMVFLAVPLAYGAAHVLGRARARGGAAAGRALAAVLVVAMAVEFAGRALPLDDLPVPASDVYAWIADQPGDFGILEWPIPDSLDQSAPGQWLSTRHWKRRVTGHNGRVPEDVQRLYDLSFRPLDDEFFEFLVAWFPVRYVVVRLDEFTPEARAWMLTDGLPVLERWWAPVRSFGSDRVYRPRNGGVAGELRRRFPSWMVRGDLVVRLTAPWPLDAPDASLSITVDGRPLVDAVLTGGTREVAASVPDGLVGTDLVWIRVLGPPTTPVDIESLRFRTPEGIVYP